MSRCWVRAFLSIALCVLVISNSHSLPTDAAVPPPPQEATPAQESNPASPTDAQAPQPSILNDALQQLPSQDQSPPSPQQQEQQQQQQQEQQQQEQHQQQEQQEVPKLVGGGAEGGAGQGGNADDALAQQIALQQQQIASQIAAHGHAHAHGGEGHHIHSIALHKDPNQLVPHGSHTHTLAETERDSGFIMGVLLSTVIISQFLLVAWRKYHVSSYNVMSFIGLWIIPFAWSVYGRYWRMLLVWLIYTAFSAHLLLAARKKPLDRSTPRRIYKWFFIVYRLCYYLTVGGYALVMSDIFGISFLLPFGPLSPIGIMSLFYGLYYGVLVRDTAHLVSNHLARSLGYFSKSGIPSRQLTDNICAICDQDLIPKINGQMPDPRARPDPNQEMVYKLDCGHQFHDSCIKGWMLVGKRDVCAACSEKVNVKQVFAKAAKELAERQRLYDQDGSFAEHRAHAIPRSPWPWEAQSMAWAVLLDGVRFLVVFNPIILTAAQYILVLVY